MYKFDRNDYEKRVKWYQEARFGMFIHWGIYSVCGRGEWVRNRKRIPQKEYADLYGAQFKACLLYTSIIRH